MVLRGGMSNRQNRKWSYTQKCGRKMSNQRWFYDGWFYGTRPEAARYDFVDLWVSQKKGAGDLRRRRRPRRTCIQFRTCERKMVREMDGRAERGLGRRGKGKTYAIATEAGIPMTGTAMMDRSGEECVD